MPKKFRWSKVYESSEEELVTFLQARNIQAKRATAEATSKTLQQTSLTGTTLWCAEGSLTIRQQSTTTSLQPGDAVSIAANTPYDITAGIAGYVCYITVN